MTGHADALRLTQTSMVGGSSESETAEVTVSPVLASPEPAVITLTPPTRCRIASLKVASGLRLGRDLSERHGHCATLARSEVRRLAERTIRPSQNTLAR